jgi:hypothetical protein
MKTVHTIDAGRLLVILRSDGQVYVADKSDVDTSSFGSFAEKAKPVASSAPGCDGLADALHEMATFIREHKS